MADDPNKPAAASGISQADLNAAVAAARTEGHKAGEVAGANAANDRLSAIVSAEGIKGDGARITAAVDLAVKSPGMSATDVTAFVTANIAAGGGKKTSPAALENRQASDPLASADQPDAGKAKAGWDAAFKHTPAH